MPFGKAKTPQRHLISGLAGHFFLFAAEVKFFADSRKKCIDIYFR